MAKRLIARASASVILEVFIRDSSSSSGAGLTGLVFNTSGLTCYYHRNTAAAAVAVTLVTMTVGTFTSSGFKEVDATNMPGVYQLCLPDAAFANGAQSVAVILKGAANMVPVAIEIELSNFDVQNSVTQTGDAYARLGAPAGASVSADVATLTGRLTAGRASNLDNLDLAVSSRLASSAYVAPDNGGISEVRTVAEQLSTMLEETDVESGDYRFDADALANVPRSGYTLTSGERTAIANEVEAQIIDETDSEKVLKAITDKIASVNPSLAGLTLPAIANAVWTAGVRTLTGADDSSGVTALLTRLTPARALLLDSLVRLDANVSDCVRVTWRGHAVAPFALVGGQVTLDGTASAVDQLYRGQILYVRAGTGAGQMHTIYSYDGASRTATLDYELEVQLDATSEIEVIHSLGVDRWTNGAVMANVVYGDVQGNVGGDLKGSVWGRVRGGALTAGNGFAGVGVVAGDESGNALTPLDPAAVWSHDTEEAPLGEPEMSARSVLRAARDAAAADSAGVSDLLTRLSAIRAAKLDNLDVPVSSRLDADDYVAPVSSDGFTADDRASLEAVGLHVEALGDGRVVVLSPVSPDGSSLEIVAGDDYLAADGRAIVIEVANSPDLTGATVKLTARDGVGTQISLDGEVITPTGTPKRIRFEVEAETSGGWSPGKYRGDIEATLSGSGSIVTLQFVEVTVLRDYTRAQA